MSQYTAKIIWRNNAKQDFAKNQYSRAHQWYFDGGACVEASASPHIVPRPYSVAENVDPEEAFVASLSSCHMLFFLHIAAKQQLTIESYIDNASGVMATNQEGQHYMSQVTLRPEVKFTESNIPNKQELEQMHHQAHQQCFIANSVKTKVVTEIVL